MEPEKKITTEVSQKNLDVISFFSKDANFVFLFKKTEKLASAVYLVTSLMSENEPLKWILRKRVSELLSLMLKYKDVSDSEQSDFVYNIRTEVLGVVSHLEVANQGKLISTMNFSVLNQEFSNLLSVFSASEKEGKQSYNSPLPENFLDSKTHDFARHGGMFTRENLGNITTSDSSVLRGENSPGIYLKDKEEKLQNLPLQRSSRQNVILSLLKKKKEITIKDVAQVIKGCSEKTLQRELNSFISMGILKRTGVRRWSRYSLK